MKQFQEWLAASLLRYFLFCSIFWGVLTYASSFVFGRGETTPAEIAIRIASALLFGGLMTAVAAYRRGRSGGRTVARAISDAAKRGSIPPDSDAAIWIPALQRQVASLRRSRWLTPMVLGIFAVLAVLIATEGEPALGGLCLALFAAAIIMTELQIRRRLPLLEHLLLQFQPRP